MNIEKANMEFENFDAFIEWKETEERDTNSWYVQRCGPRLACENKQWYYYCSRAGHYQTRGKYERNLKSQETSKVISHCSAYIKATRNAV